MLFVGNCDMNCKKCGADNTCDSSECVDEYTYDSTTKKCNRE